MKIYIVTSGDYSEYGIRKVFLDKEKADQYANAIGKHYPQVEEWETNDDITIKPLYYVCAQYSKKAEYDKRINIEINQTNTAENSEDDIKKNQVEVSYDKNKIKILVQSVIPEHSDEEKIKDKYTKILFDIMAKVESLLHIEGWSADMVEESLNENSDEKWNMSQLERPYMYHKGELKYKINDEVVALVAVEKNDNGFIPDGTHLYERRVRITGVHRDEPRYLYSGYELERTTTLEDDKKIIQDYFGSDAEIEGDKIYVKLTEHLRETN